MHEEAIRKADVLIEAMGFIRKFHGRFTVIKLGGSVMEDPSAPRLAGRRRLHANGGHAAGGGPRRRQGDHRAMEKAGLTARFVQGRRYTDDATLEIVAQVLAEEINADIERHINKFGGRASGLHHKTHQCLFGKKLWLENGQRGRSTWDASARSPRSTCRRSRISAWPASFR